MIFVILRYMLYARASVTQRTFRPGRVIATFPQLHVYDPVLGGDMDRLGTVMDKVLFDAVRAS